MSTEHLSSNQCHCRACVGDHLGYGPCTLPLKHKIPELPSELRRVAKISTSGYWAGVFLEAADEIDAARRQDEMSEVSALRAVIARLEDWANQGSAEWCQKRYEDDVLVNQVIAECEALRRGVGVTYSAGDDPLQRLKHIMPTMEQLEVCQRALREYRPAVKATEQCPRCSERQGPTCNYCGREFL